MYCILHLLVQKQCTYIRVNRNKGPNHFNQDWILTWTTLLYPRTLFCNLLASFQMPKAADNDFVTLHSEQVQFNSILHKCNSSLFRMRLWFLQMHTHRPTDRSFLMAIQHSKLMKIQETHFYSLIFCLCFRNMNILLVSKVK